MKGTIKNGLAKMSLVGKKTSLSLGIAGAINGQNNGTQILNKTKQHINSISEKIEPSIIKGLCPLDEIKRIAKDCKNSGKKAVIVVRNKEISIFIHNYISENKLDEKDHIILISITNIKKEILSSEFNKCIFFDLPNLGKNNKTDEGVLERREIVNLKRNFPYIQPEFIFFSRKGLDNKILWITVSRLYESVILNKNDNNSIGVLLKNEKDGQIKEYILEPKLEYIDNIEVPTSENQIENLILDEISKYSDKSFFGYVSDEGQKKRLINKMDARNIHNIELVVSNEIGYHYAGNKQGIAFFSQSNSLDKITKAYKNILKNKKNQIQFVFSVNTRIKKKNLDSEAFNRIKSLDFNIEKDQRSNGNKKENKSRQVSLESTGGTSHILNSHSTLAEYTIDFNTLADDDIINEINLAFQQHNPQIADIATLKYFGFGKLRKKIKALDAFFSKYKKYNYKIFSNTAFQRLVGIYKTPEYFKEKAQTEIKDVFKVTNGKGFFQLALRNIGDKTLRGGKSIPYISYIHETLNIVPIKKIKPEHKIKIIQYLYGEDFSLNGLGPKIKKEFSNKKINHLVQLLEHMYFYKTDKRIFNSVDKTNKDSLEDFLRTSEYGSLILKHPSGSLLIDGKFTSQSILSLAKIVFKEDFENLENKLKQYTIAEINNTFFDEAGESINPFLITGDKFREEIWKQDKSAFKLLLHILTDNRFPNIHLDESSQINHSKGKFTKTMQDDILDYLGYEYPVNIPYEKTGVDLFSEKEYNYTKLCYEWELNNNDDLEKILKKYKVLAEDINSFLKSADENQLNTIKKIFTGDYNESIEKNLKNGNPHNIIKLILDIKNKRLDED